MRHVTGIHIQNKRDADLGWLLRVAGRAGAVTMLHEQLGMYAELRRRAPDLFIHIRIYHPNSLSVDPVQYARFAFEALRPSGVLSDPKAGVSLSNEVNLHYENGDGSLENQWRYKTVEWYSKHAAWAIAVWAELDRLAPGRLALRVSDAYAYGHEPPRTRLPDGTLITGEPGSEYTIPLVRRYLSECDVLASHPYAHLEWSDGAKTAPGGADYYWHLGCEFRPARYKNADDPGGLLAQFPGKPLLFSECGTFTHSHDGKEGRPWRTPQTRAAMAAFIEDARRTGRVIGTCWFIANSGPEHGDNLIYPNSELSEFLAAVTPRETAASLPQRGATVPPPPTPTPEPPVSNAFVVGPGATATLRALGDKPASSETYFKVSNHYGPTEISFTAGERHLVLWLKETGQTIIIPRLNGAGGGDPEPTVRLAGYPIISQLNDPYADGRDNRWNNCGAAAAAMEIKYRTGVHRWPDETKDAVYGEDYAGYTFMTDWARWLTDYCEMPSEARSGGVFKPLRPVVEDTLRQGYGLIVLFQMPTFRHICPVTGFGPDGVWYADPLTAQEGFLDWPTFEAKIVDGWHIVVRRQRDPNLAR